MRVNGISLSWKGPIKNKWFENLIHRKIKWNNIITEIIVKLTTLQKLFVCTTIGPTQNYVIRAPIWIFLNCVCAFRCTKLVVVLFYGINVFLSSLHKQFAAKKLTDMKHVVGELTACTYAWGSSNCQTKIK